ncbi:histidine kinase dimerization/phosphoacceptor domain-containing protein [Streptosporangium sp. NPDC051023]|uniref:histidine kinase dimerization/phosphoacceptor domain-containing protein n=1 Tax=Streptosporangium sp. NPDC051023 TaxID=3155410 RepID=UPI00345017CF
MVWWGLGTMDRGVTVRLRDPAEIWWLPWLLLTVVVLYGLAVRYIAEIAALAAGAAVVGVAVTVAVRGHHPRTVAGVTLVAAALAAAAWSTGRARRRRTARRSALTAHRVGARAIPGFAADTERLRFATELHDTLVHRLTGIVACTSAALHLADPGRLTHAMRNAAESGRHAVTELNLLAAHRHPAPAGLAEIDDLVAA